MPYLTKRNMPRALLACVPETAVRLAQGAVEAFELEPAEAGLPAPPDVAIPREVTEDDRAASAETIAYIKRRWIDGVVEPPPPERQLTPRHPYYRALDERIGLGLAVNFGPYGLCSQVFNPVFRSALFADPFDEGLVRRCCAFIEEALAGEELVAEAVTMMVIENIGKDCVEIALPFAGPLFRRELRSCHWID